MSADLVYGDTGSGKTVLLATLAEWVWKTHQKVTRYYVCDLGGIPDRMRVLIEAGIVEMWRVRSRDPDGTLGLPMGTLKKACRGFWPRTIDPKTGATPPGVELIAPVTFKYVVTCGHCKKETEGDEPVGQGGWACKQCGTHNTAAAVGPVKRVVVQRPEFAHVGAVVYDGLTSMAAWAMTDLDYRAGQGVLGGEKGNLNTVKSDGEVFGISGRGGVGFAQNRGYDWIHFAVDILGLVTPPVFTALEDKGSDNESAVVYGPKLVGRARTADIPSWFGNTLCIQEVQGKHRIYTRKTAIAPNPIPHLAKVRVEDGEMPDFYEDEPGKPFSRFNLGYFYTQLAKAQEKVQARVTSELGDAKAAVAKMKAEAKPQQLLVEDAYVSSAEALQQVAQRPAAAPQPTGAPRAQPPAARPAQAPAAAPQPPPAPAPRPPAQPPVAPQPQSRPTPRPSSGAAPGAPPVAPPVKTK